MKFYKAGDGGIFLTISANLNICLQVMADTDVEEARTILPAAGYMDTGDIPDSIDWREKS